MRLGDYFPESYGQPHPFRSPPPLLNNHTAILTLQNGLGNEAFLASHFGQERILGGLCFVYLNRTKPGLVEHFSQGMIALGEYERPPAERTILPRVMICDSGRTGS